MAIVNVVMFIWVAKPNVEICSNAGFQGQEDGGAYGSSEENSEECLDL